MRKALMIAAFAVLTGLVIGCGNGKGELTGKVTYNGKPVPGGNLTLTINGMQFISALSTDGSYEFFELVPGQAVLTVDNEKLNPDSKRPEYFTGKSGGGNAAQAMSKMAKERMKAEGKGVASGLSSADMSPEMKAEMAKRYMKIPVKYTNEQTSDAKVMVKAGRNEWNFVLKD